MVKFWRHFFRCGVQAIILVALSLVIGVAADSADPSVWFGDSELNLQKQSYLSAKPASLNGNIDCLPDTGTNCVIPTIYGSADSNGKINLNHTAGYYPAFTQTDNQQHVQAIPNSNTAISYSISPVTGWYLYFNHDFSASITKVKYYDGFTWTYKYVVNRPPDGRLADQDGHMLAADYDSMSFSADGRWMVVSEPNTAMLRVDLDTLEATPFAPGFNYLLGLDPLPQTAITNDGRFAVVASKNFNFFKIYDLDSCAKVPGTISGPVECGSRDLRAFMQSRLSAYASVSNLRFINNDTLSLFATSKPGGLQTTAKYTLSTAASNPYQLDYLALGDSYISGEGAFNYQTGTDSDTNRCHISWLSYPYLLGHDLGYNSYHTVACSGATTADIIDQSASYSGQALPKTPRGNQTESRVDTILSGFMPGYIDQLDFTSQYQPRVITVSVGGNDMGFSSILKRCIMPDSCYSSYEDRLELVREINDSVFSKLVSTYQQIKAAGAPDAKIFTIGYPQIALPGGDCADNVHLDASEVNFSAQLISYLDSVIQAAAAKAGVGYIDVQKALNGHRLCEGDRYSVALNGLSAGNDSPRLLHGPFGNESFHPNYIGHQLLEAAVVVATANLSSAMPGPDPSAHPPAEEGLEILNAPKSGRGVNVTEYDSGISSDIIYKDSLGDVNINGASHSLPPTSNIQIELHSDPVLLGAFSTDSSGDLTAQIHIPDAVQPGFHRLDILVKDISGQDIDIYKTVYIAASPDDWDGNKLPDRNDICVGTAPSGQDLDHDSVDDSCDGYIGRTQAYPAEKQSPAAEPDVLAASTTKPTVPPAKTNQYKTASQNLRVPMFYIWGAGLAAAAFAVLAFATKD